MLLPRQASARLRVLCSRGLRSSPRARDRQTSCPPVGPSPLFLPLPYPCLGLSRGTGSRAQAPRSLRRRV